MQKQIIKIFFLLALFLIVPKFAQAATYYVSPAPIGSDANDGSIDHPWLTPAYGAKQLAAGDTLYLMEGTYDNTLVQSAGATIAILPKVQNVTIAGYPGQKAIITGNGGVAPTGWVIGANSSTSGMTIKDLTIKGSIAIFDASNVTVQNCDISVGGDLWIGNLQGETIYIQRAVNTLIQNNVFHDNVAQSGGSNNLILVYKSDGLIIQNNELYHSVSGAINVKDTSNNAIIRYNFIHDNFADGIWTANQGNSFVSGGNTYSMTDNLNIYQNVITNNVNGAGINLVIKVQSAHIFNNTFYNNLEDFYHANGEVNPVEFFNNISFNPKSYFLYWPGGGYSSLWDLSYLDYNDYYRAAGPVWNYRYTNYNSLGAWQTEAQSFLAGAETNSVLDNPGFINASGNFNTPTDFKRTAYSANGRGGGTYSNVIGAYITGNEQIGVTQDVVAPASPTGLLVE